MTEHSQRSPTLRETYGRRSSAWEDKIEPVIRFQLDDEEEGIVAFPFFSLLNARLLPKKEAVLLEFQAGNIVLQGPKVREFYEEFCRQRATAVKADGKDILSVTLVLPTPLQEPDPPSS